MDLSNLKPTKGSTFKRKRVGRGDKLAGRGRDGQNSRSGGGVRPGFEGGQLPLYIRIPKRGFTNYNSKEIIGINVSSLNIFEDGTVVTVEALKDAGIVSNPKDGVKILGSGQLTKKLTVQVNMFSKTAIDKIEAAGGKAEVV